MAESPRTGDLIDLRRERSRRLRVTVDLDEDDLLHRIALVLNSTLDLREVLRRLTHLALRVSRAQRCSIFRLDGRLLCPEVAVGVDPDEDLWQAFRAMGPIRLDAIPGVDELLRAGAPFVVEDAATSPLIAGDWAERFRLQSLVLVPLSVAADPIGLFVVDYPTRRAFADDEIELLELLADYASVAVRNARLHEQAQRRATVQAALARAAATLSSSAEPATVARSLVAAYDDLLDAAGSAIGLLDEDRTRLTVVAATGSTNPHQIPFGTVPAHIVETLTDAWAKDAHARTGFAADAWLARLTGVALDVAKGHVVWPLTVGGTPRGLAIVTLPTPTRIDTEANRAARALADLAAAALERSGLLERLSRHARHMEALYAISTAVLGPPDAAAVAERLSGLLAPDGISVESIVLLDATLASRTGARLPGRDEDDRWLDGEAVAEDGRLAVPMLLGGEVVGAVHVRPSDLGEEDLRFLQAVGRGVAEVLVRGALRASLDAAARERAIAAERDRIGDDLHDSVGQVLVAIGLLAGRHAEQLPAESPWRPKFDRIADLAESGRWEMDQAVRAIANVPSADRGLPAALRDLARAFESDSGIHTIVDSQDAPAHLPPQVERCLYRIAHESLINAWRHARCAAVHLKLAGDGSKVTLRVVDDGIGLGPTGPEPGIGLTSMRRSVSDVGGRLRVRDARPHGAAVEATVPVVR
ncbi:MAG: GAF domain-containing protein [Nitriliruptorales bacterium]